MQIGYRGSHSVSERRLTLCLLQLKARLLQYPIDCKEYNPNQPRVPAGSTNGGRWTNGEAADPTKLQLIADQSSIGLFSLAASQEECDEQYRRDIIVCKFTGMRSCYAQAMVRLVACERGQPIPPLNF